MENCFDERLLLFLLVIILLSTSYLQILLHCLINHVKFGAKQNENLAKFKVTSKNKGMKSIESLPGPKPFPIRIIGNLFQLPNTDDTVIPKFFEWCDKYGPCFRVTLLGVDFVVISSASLAQSVLQSNELGHLTKTDVYKLLKEIDGLAFSSGKRWQTMRKIASPAFHYNTVERRICYSNIRANHLADQLKNPNNSNELVELLTASCTVNIIIDSFISGPGHCTQVDTINYLKNWKRYTEITQYRMIHPWLCIDLIWRYHSLYQEMNAVVANLYEFAELLIKPHLQNASDTRNQQENVLISEMRKLGYSNERIRGEVLTMLFGYEAFFYGLYYLMYMLAVHPEQQRQCQQEVDLLHESKNRGSDFLTHDDLVNLKYLERCLFETLRMLPGAFTFGRKLETDLELENGVLLPAGTNVLVVPVVIHKMSEYFLNPETFDPDRFLPENSSNRHPFSFLPFSAGPRVCMGMKPAILSVKVIMAKILRKFTIKSSTKLKDIKFKVSLAMVPERSLDLSFVPRS